MARTGYKKISTNEEKEAVSFLSLLLFQWMNGIFKIGSERPLDKNDFLSLSKENSASFLTDQLQENWSKEKTKCNRIQNRPKLWKSVIKLISVKDVMIIGFTNTLYSISRILQPLLLGYFISMLMSAEPKKDNLLYGCTLALCINSVIGLLGVHQQDYRCELLGTRMSCALKGLVYHKTLHLSKDVLQKFTTGHVIDLISNDVQRLEEDTVMWISLSISSCLVLVALAVLLVYLIGWQSLMGVFFLCFLVPYFLGFSYVHAAQRVRAAAVSDRRISLMNQVVSGIRAIKTRAWEDDYRKKVQHTRRSEINIIRTKSAIASGFLALWDSSVSVATLLSVVTLVLTGQAITPVNLFMLIGFMDIAGRVTCLIISSSLLQTYEAYASLKRIEEFLLLENVTTILRDRSKEGISDAQSSSTNVTSGLLDRQFKQEVVFNPDLEQNLQDKPGTLYVSNLTYRQIERQDEFILQDIEFSTASQSLTVITGPVGSGKSTLLSAIAGEIFDASGTITFPGSIVYVPQTPWIFSGTLRENILFGQPYDEPKYTRVIEACALTKDIQRFPDYDQTVVGERGEVLSGGQQARVSLARAVYADADLYLLDDPLSAVDFKVGQHIFKTCINDLLGDKTRVLSSHQEQHLKEADQVILLYKGRVLEKGSFTKLQAKGILNTTVDPLYQRVGNDGELNNNVAREIKQKDKGDDGRETMAPLPSDARGLEISQEDRSIGEVSSKLYWNYFRSGVHWSVICAVICLCIVTQAMLVAPDVWLSSLSKKLPEEQKDRTNLTIYACLVSASLIFAIIRAYGFLLVSLRCSERLHDKMVLAILQAPVLFFDSNPVGRILNRFSKDVGCLDELLPKTFLVSIQQVLVVFASIIVPTVTNPWLLFLVIPLIVLVLCISKYYLKTSRELKRLESICRSPVFSHFSETLNGLDTIRTRGRQRDFEDQFYRYQDVHNQSYIMTKASGRWLGVRLDLFASMLIGAVSLAAILVSQDAAWAGLALVYVIRTSISTQYAVKKTSDVENFMTSVERVMTYTKLDSEPGYKVHRLPPEHWPHEGNITFKDVSLTYYPGGPQVLTKINLNIKGGTKIGVAGRTGAGKSSFLAALTRMPDADGDILIDDIPIKQINLQEVRRCISVLGQSPVLFSGSLRKNLDLLEQLQDADLWRALEDVQLKELVESLDGKLDHELMEHGANLSVGERQLICLARVLLQQNKIVILDEPTAHVDPETEQTIWNVVREKLKDSTVITIAHRLSTIKDCDMILVLKDGEVDEFDKFDTLVNKKGGALNEMAQVADI